MTTKSQKNGIKFATALSILSIFSQYASAAIFEFNIANAGESVGKPTDDGQTFQQQWGTAANWKLVSGEDDGNNGYPDGADTAIINRSALANNSTRLTEESSSSLPRFRWESHWNGNWQPRYRPENESIHLRRSGMS
jgi:hypothetical protein